MMFDKKNKQCSLVHFLAGQQKPLSCQKYYRVFARRYQSFDSFPSWRRKVEATWPKWQDHRENGGTFGMVPLIINPIYTLYSGYLLGISPFKGYHHFPHDKMTKRYEEDFAWFCPQGPLGRWDARLPRNHPHNSKEILEEKLLVVRVQDGIFQGALWVRSQNDAVTRKSTWVFPKIVVPQNGWFIKRENPIKMDDLGVPLFLETPT